MTAAKRSSVTTFCKIATASSSASAHAAPRIATHRPRGPASGSMRAAPLAAILWLRTEIGGRISRPMRAGG